MKNDLQITVVAANIVDVDGTYGNRKPGNYYGCFGFLDGTLYLGDTHHASIIAGLVQNETYDWDSLMAAKQMWGWFSVDEDLGGGKWWDESSGTGKYYGDLTFATDDAKQSYGIKGQLRLAFKEAFPWVNSWTIQKGTGSTTQNNYGQRARDQYLEPKDPWNY